MSRAPMHTREESSLEKVEYVTLVDAEDRVVGSCEKIAAHREGRLHRAFSILITNPDGEFLLQRRASRKYHFAGRWSNACCGHPRPGEDTLAAARRRLAEELGVVVPLRKVIELSYRTVDPASGLVEHEYLHVVSGQCVGGFRPDPNEVSALRWMGLDALQRALELHPERFTPWFRLLVSDHSVLHPRSAANAERDAT